MNAALPSNGISGEFNMAEIRHWTIRIAESVGQQIQLALIRRTSDVLRGMQNGWAMAWKAEPHEICQGAQYTKMKLNFSW